MKSKEAKAWRASSNGPDWTDVAMMTRELEKLHQVWISVRILNAGYHNSNGLRIVCSAFTSVLVATAEAGVVLVDGEWPNANSASLEATVYALLHKMDAKLSSALWKQEQLFEEQPEPA